MKSTALIPGRYYHIYNRGTNGEVLFKHPAYYEEFLQLYSKYSVPVADTLAYCLMSNHFHLLIRVKDEHEIRTFEELNMFVKDESNQNPLKKQILFIAQILKMFLKGLLPGLHPVNSKGFQTAVLQNRPARPL